MDVRDWYHRSLPGFYVQALLYDIAAVTLVLCGAVYPHLFHNWTSKRILGRIATIACIRQQTKPLSFSNDKPARDRRRLVVW